MEILTSILGVLGSAASGGLIGLIGTAIKGWQQHKEKQQEIELVRLNREYDLKEMDKEAELKLRQTETELAGKANIADIETDAAKEVAASKTLRASYSHDKATYSVGVLDKLRGMLGNFSRSMLVMVDVFRGMMRPVITLYLLGVNSIVAWELHILVQGMVASDLITADQAWPLYSQTINALAFLTSTAVTWWFGSRPHSRSH